MTDPLDPRGRLARDVAAGSQYLTREDVSVLYDHVFVERASLEQRQSDWPCGCDGIYMIVCTTPAAAHRLAYALVAYVEVVQVRAWDHQEIGRMIEVING